MAQTPETLAIKAVHDKLDPARIRAWKVHDDFHNGIYDCHYRNKLGVKAPSLCAEYKYMPSWPARSSTLIRVKWSCANQETELTETYNTGQPAVAIVAIGKGAKRLYVIFHTPEEWINGITTAAAELRAVPAAKVAEFIQAIVFGTVASAGNNGDFDPQRPLL